MVEENGFFKMFLVREYAKHAFLISGWANASGNLNSTEARRMCFWKMFPVKSMLSVKVWSTRREWGSVVCQIISKDFVAFLGIKHIWCLLSLLQQRMYQWECHCAGANCSWGEVGWTVAINCPITPYRRREYNIGTTLRAESESTKEHNLHMGTDWLFLRRFCVIQPSPLSLPWRGSDTTRKMCNKEEFTKSSESQRSHWETALRVLRLYKTLMCKAPLSHSANRDKSLSLPPKLCKLLFFSSATWTPPYHLDSLQSLPKVFTKGLKEILDARAGTQADAPCFCLSEKMTWQKCQHHWTCI